MSSVAAIMASAIGAGMGLRIVAVGLRSLVLNIYEIGRAV